jgi:hypothetical protein
MDGVPTLLLLALVLTWLAWRAARRRNQLLAAQRAAEQDRHSHTLDAREADDGRGFDVVDAEGRHLDPDALDWREHGLLATDVVAFSAEPDAGGSPDFAPGATVALIPADDDPRRVEVWNAGMTACAGALPDDVAALVLDATEQHAVGECLVLWEHTWRGSRTGVRLLLVRQDMLLDS